MNIPQELIYTKDHEWARKAGDEITIGITDFAQGELGDIIFVELPAVDDEFDQADPFGTIEAVKTVADLFMPVSGTITAINEELEDNPEAVNNDPYGDGWIVKIALSNPDELDQLLSANDYQALVD